MSDHDLGFIPLLNTMAIICHGEELRKKYLKQNAMGITCHGEEIRKKYLNFEPYNVFLKVYLLSMGLVNKNAAFNLYFKYIVLNF